MKLLFNYKEFLMSKYSLHSVPALIVVTTAMAWGMPAQAIGLLGGVNTNAGVGTNLAAGPGVGIGVNAQIDATTRERAQTQTGGRADMSRGASTEGAASAQMGAGATTSANGGVPMDGMRSTTKRAAQAGKKTLKPTGNGVGSTGASGRVGVQGEAGGSVQ
jgi:hypothetical protein